MRIEFLCGYSDAIEEIMSSTDITKEKLSLIIKNINADIEKYNGSLTDSEWITVLMDSVELVTNDYYEKDFAGRPIKKYISAEKAVEMSLASVIKNSIIPDKYQRKM